MLFPTSALLYVWRMPKVANNPECLVLSVKYGDGYGSVMIWAAISWYSPGPIITWIG